MPSAPGYKRNYKQEWKTAKGRGEGKDNAARHRLRRLATKKGIVRQNDGKDLAHKTALSQGGPTTISNVTVQSPSKNRSFKRTSSGAMKRGLPPGKK